MEVPTRRLRRKTSLGQAVVTLATQLAVVAAVVAAVAAGGWVPDFLDAEELAPEDEDKRKQVYLVTLPHPRVVEGGDRTLSGLCQNSARALRILPGLCQDDASTLLTGR